MPTPVLYLTVGLPGVGKTTMAREIAAQHSLVRLTADEWMVTLYGESDDAKRDVLEARLIELAHQILSTGQGVILDLGCWSPDERWALRAIAESTGAKFQMIVPIVSETVRRQRTSQRWQENPSQNFEITDADQERFLTLYHPPTDEERNAATVPPSPAGTTSWGHWATYRWPTLPQFATAV